MNRALTPLMFSTLPPPTHVLARVMEGLASNCSKMHCEIDIGATKSCIFIILIYFSIKPESGKIQDLVARMSISQYILL
jgi:hypothetical protein